MRIAAQLYTLRDFLKTPEDMAVTLQKVKDIGYNAVQVSGIGPIDNQALKDMLDRIGLTVCATHIGYADFTERLDDVIAKHKLWGCQYVGLGSMPGDFRKSRAAYSEFAKLASDISRKLQAAGLQFVYHNHAFEFAHYEGKSGMNILFDETDPSFGFELDVHWVHTGGADAVEWINKVKGRMQVVHLKDYIITPESERRFAEVGEGNMNFRRILDACEATGVEWGAVEQDNCYGRDPFESLAISAKNLKALGAKF